MKINRSLSADEYYVSSILYIHIYILLFREIPLQINYTLYTLLYITAASNTTTKYIYEWVYMYQVLL